MLNSRVTKRRDSPFKRSTRKTSPHHLKFALFSFAAPWERLMTEEEEEREETWMVMREQERETLPNVANIDQQPEVGWELRPLLLDFLVQVHSHLGLLSETLHLAVNLMNRYMSRVIVTRKHYQLVGVTCLWLATKYEESARVPRKRRLRVLCDNAYEERAFDRMEAHILATIGWRVGAPTPEAFLRLIVEREGGMESREVLGVARFLMEVSLFHRGFVGVGACRVARACLAFARYILENERVDDSLTGLVQLLDHCLCQVSRVVHDKYASPAYECASVRVMRWADEGNRFVPIVVHGMPTPPMDRVWEHGRIWEKDGEEADENMDPRQRLW
ncbi:uncharacterized protein VTP21DRAFT_4861 [Calcarisporiella thermophila]|uniref:uncharacterized protein n=1 Tax=Calcarisporiella thermophila TaxID=911321 RepID=UPI003742B24E